MKRKDILKIRIQLESALEDLIKLLSNHYGKGVVVLIDEYDRPFMSSFQHNYFEDFRDFMQYYFSDIDRIETFKVVMMGTSLDWIENLTYFDTCSTRYHDYSDYLGINEDELMKLCKAKDNSLSTHATNNVLVKDSLKAWYGGYKFGDYDTAIDTYKPVSVLKYLSSSNGEFQSHWIDTTEDVRLIDKFMLKNPKNLDILVKILEGKYENLFYFGSLGDGSDKYSKDNFLRILYATSYLMEKSYYLEVPNEEAWFELKKIAQRAMTQPKNKSD